MATVEKIRRDIEKTKEKISEQQKRLRALEAQLTEEENLEIVRMVKAVKMDNRELTAFLKAYASGLITLPEGMEIDLGSVAKGYAGQLVAQMLREHGVQSALLNLGGNVQTVGAKPDGSPWQIGIKDPQGEDAMMVLSVEDQAVVTSGGYERYFEQDGQTYWHIMDPSTGHPADSGLISVTIVGDEGVVCDGLSTALFVMGLEKAADLWAQSGDFEAVFVTASGEVYITEGLRDHFALTERYADTPVSVIER